MPKKKIPKAETPKSTFMVYVTQTGGYIGGEEVNRDGPHVYVKDPVFVTTSPDGSGFDMNPVQFVVPGSSLRLYAYGLMGDAPMPIGMLPWYEKHQQRRVKQESLQP